MPEPKDYARRFVKGSSVVFGALVVAGVIGLALRMFLTRSLSVFDYGLFYLIFAFVSLLALFRDLGINAALTKFIPEFIVKKQFGKVKSSMAFAILFQMLFALPITLVLFFFSDQIAIAIAGTASASIIVKILGIWFLAIAFFHVLRSSYQGFQDLVPYSMMEVFYILITFFFVVLSVHIFNLGVGGVALGFLIAIPILVITWLVIIWKRHPRVLEGKVQIEKPLIKKILRFALPVFIGSIGGLILGHMDTVMIGLFHNPAEVGLYQGARPLASLISYFPSALGVVLLPMTSEIWARGEKKFLGEALHPILKFSFMIIIPAVFVFMSFPDVVLRSVFGPSYVLAAVTLQILTLAVIATTLSVILGSIAMGIGKPIIITKVVGAMACLNFIGNLILIPAYGIVGAAIATFISGLVGLFVMIYLVRQFVKFTLPISTLLKTLVAGTVMLFLIFALKQAIVLPPWWLETIVAVIPSLLCYVVLILVMGAIRKRDLMLLKETLPIPKKLIKIAKRLARD